MTSRADRERAARFWWARESVALPWHESRHRWVETGEPIPEPSSLWDDHDPAPDLLAAEFAATRAAAIEEAAKACEARLPAERGTAYEDQRAYDAIDGCADAIRALSDDSLRALAKDGAASEPACILCKRPSNAATAPIRPCLDCGQAICASCADRGATCEGARLAAAPKALK